MSKKYKIYLAGPLFIKSEIEQRRAEAARLRSFGFDVYSPIEMNDDIGFDLDELYRRDIAAMEQADFCVLCLDSLDSGTVAELGWFVAKGKPVYSTWTNWKYPQPNNLFVRGLAINNGNKIFGDLEALYTHLTKTYCKGENE